MYRLWVLPPPPHIWIYSIMKYTNIAVAVMRMYKSIYISIKKNWSDTLSCKITLNGFTRDEVIELSLLLCVLIYNDLLK